MPRIIVIAGPPGGGRSTAFPVGSFGVDCFNADDRAAEIAKESATAGRTVREICLEKKVLPVEDLERALDPVGMTEPGGEGSAGG